MFKNVLLAVATLIACPSLVSAQDIIWSFSPTELTTTASGELGETGSVYICANTPFYFDFNGLDLDFTTSGACVKFTGGETFNPEAFGGLGGSFGGSRFDTIALTFDQEGSSGNLFAVDIQDTTFLQCILIVPCPDFPNSGPDGTYLLARVDYEIVGVGNNIDLEFALGDNGAVMLPTTILNPSFGSATLDLQPETSVLLGDVNLDGIVDFFDIFAFIAVLESRTFQLEADLNQDCKVNFLDISPFITYLNNQ